MNDRLPSIVAIDVGTHKIAVLIGRVHAPDRIEVVGMAHARNRGMSKGLITHMDKLVADLKEAVAEAEERANCRIHTAWVAIPSPQLISHNAAGRTVVHEGAVTTTEVVRTLEAAKSSHVRPDHYLINAVSQGMQLDEQEEWVDHPIGMAASFITGYYHLMMLPIQTMQNMERAMKAANVGIDRLVVSSLATAEAMLLPDEREYGVCLIDLGAGTTNVSVYLQKQLVLSHTFQLGGERVTRDIASVLQTTTEQAESLKLRHGCVDRKLVKADQMITVPGVGAAPGLTVSRLELTDIIAARYEDILERVARLLNDQGLTGLLQHGVVLTGEASQVEGLPALARQCLQVPVHLGNLPAAIEAATEDMKIALKRPLYATALGLLLYTQSEQRLAESRAEEAARGKPLVERLVVSPWRRTMDRLKQLF